MRCTPILLLTALLLSCSGPETKETVKADPLAPYRQLVGDWIDNTTDTAYTCYEHWLAEGDSAMSGIGHVIADGDTVFIEHLRLSVQHGNVIYSARVGSQNNGAWVPFTAQPTGSDTLMFENAAHDFPQCITYAKTNDGAWDVAVTGNEHGEERSERFRFHQR